MTVGSERPSRRRLTFVATADQAREHAPGTTTVVLDESWTPDPGDASGGISIRPSFAAVLERHDLFAEALAIVDGWADAGRATDVLMAEGISYWLRAREPMWHWVHERLLWRYTLAQLDGEQPFDEVSVPAEEVALGDVVRALGREVPPDDHQVAAMTGASAVTAVAPERQRSEAGRAGQPAWTGLRRALRRAKRRVVGGRADGARGATRREDAASGTAGRREAILSARIDGILRTAAPRAIVLTLPSSYQRIGGAEAGRREDPNLGSVIPALTAAGIEPIVVGWGMSSQSDEDWAIVEADDRMLPAFALKGRWGSPEDDGRGATAADAVLRGLDSMIGVPVLLDGLDVGPDFLVVLRGLLARVVRGEIVELARVERLMREVAPAAILVTQEHHRTPWLVGAGRAGVPSFALQHGMLYAAHPGYPDRRHDGLVLPTLTFVFGDFERRVLLGTAYTPADVAVSGSPRLDLDAAAGSPQETAMAREDVRRELGVAAGDLLVVVSTVPAHFIRRSHLVHMLETLLGGHLPGVHIVFKLHPGERDQGPYRALIAGLARAGRLRAAGHQRRQGHRPVPAAPSRGCPPGAAVDRAHRRGRGERPQPDREGRRDRRSRRLRRGRRRATRLERRAAPRSARGASADLARRTGGVPRGPLPVG